MDPFDHREIIGYAIFAWVAGMLGHILRTMDAGKKLKFVRVIVEGASASFVGILGWMACKAIGIEGWWVGLTVGLLSWMGASASIRMIEKIVYRKFGIRMDGGDDNVGAP